MVRASRTPRPVVFAIAILVLLALAGVAVGVGTLGEGHDRNPAVPPAPQGAADPSDDAAARSTLALQGEWLLLRIENAWLDDDEDADAEARQRNDRRIATILRELNARGV